MTTINHKDIKVGNLYLLTLNVSNKGFFIPNVEKNIRNNFYVNFKKDEDNKIIILAKDIVSIQLFYKDQYSREYLKINESKLRFKDGDFYYFLHGLIDGILYYIPLHHTICKSIELLKK